MSGLPPLAENEIELRGTHLIEAGAGTGKTYAIVSLYLRLLLERGLDVSQILVVTYTVAATSELRDRIRTRLLALATALEAGHARGEPDEELVLARVAAGKLADDRARVLEAIRSFDRAAIFTIHGFCQRVLAEHAFESGASFTSELQSDPGALLEEVAGDFFVRELHDAPAEIAEYAVEKLPFDRLLDLAGRVASHPEIEIRPPRPETSDLAELLMRWEDARRRAAACWEGRQKEILELLLDAAKRKLINGRRYAEKQMHERWAPALAELFALTSPGVLAVLSVFERLTSSGLLENPGSGGGPPPEHEFFELCEALLAADRAFLAAREAWRLDLEHAFVDYARSELARRKQERGVLFFDDLLQGLRAALEGSAGEVLAAAVRLRHPVALIDEFQDTDPVQYAIFERIWNAPDGSDALALFLIGDPKQAIYAFRGADVFAYLAARDDADANVYGLTTNYRSDPGLVEALNATFEATAEPFGTRAIRFEHVAVSDDASDRLAADGIRSGLRILFAPRREGENFANDWKGRRLAAAVASEVARLLASGAQIDGDEILPRDIAVLTRTNAQAREIQDELRRHRIVAVLQSEESVFATDEAAELERVMRAMAEPDNPARLRAALATTLLSSSADELLGLLDLSSERDEDAGGSAVAWEAWTARLRDCRQLWTDRGFVQSLRCLWLSAGIGPRLLARNDGERRVTNLLHLAELLQRQAALGRLGPLALLYWFGHRRAEAKQARRWVAEEAQLRLESDDLAVQLVTVHRSKGLEYPITVCPYLWEGTLIQQRERFPRFHAPDSGRLALDLVRDESRESYRLAKQEAFEERLRLLYVALTRSRHHCSVVWGNFDEHVGESPLAHLLHPEQGVGQGEGGLPEPGRLKDRSDASLWSDLEALAARAGGPIAIAELDGSPGPIAQRTRSEENERELRCREPRRAFSRVWRMSSFSGLVSSAPEREGPDVEEGRDFDVSSGDVSSGDVSSRDVSSRDVRSGDVTIRLADFPAGAMPGILIHRIFEQLDFTTAAGPSLDELVTGALAARGIDDAYREPLVAGIRDVLAVPLDPDCPESRLEMLARSDRIDEMAFMLPVAGTAAGPLSATKLAEVFERHATSELTRRYAKRAATLAFGAFEGQLRGFIDLVFRRDGRWYLIDYKSNHLGSAVSDYDAPDLERAMLEHDYVLQYHLYLVALHRHLQLRLPGYEYDRHLGGAHYLFIRGMAPGNPPAHGVLSDRPPRELIEALSRLFEFAPEPESEDAA